MSLSDTIKIDQEYISVNGKDVNIKPFNFQIPGDTSSAAFIIGSAIIRKGSFVKIKNLLANRYRLGFVDVLKRMGANISIYYNENNSEIDDIWAKTVTDDFIQQTLGEDEVFVLGDQRRLSSSDSRTLGPVSATECFKIKYRYWPYQRFKAYE